MSSIHTNDKHTQPIHSRPWGRKGLGRKCIQGIVVVVVQVCVNLLVVDLDRYMLANSNDKALRATRDRTLLVCSPACKLRLRAQLCSQIPCYLHGRLLLDWVRWPRVCLAKIQIQRPVDGGDLARSPRAQELQEGHGCPQGGNP